MGFHFEVGMKFPQNRILCVEDDEDTREMMKRLLELSGYEVLLSPTAADGFRLAQSERLDLYLLDSRFPDGSGLELCEQICELNGHAPVVFISGDAYEADKLRGLKAGAHAYLTKPLDFEALEETITRLIDKAPSQSAVAA
jgi:DNA-binding response OmpR family regulator